MERKGGDIERGFETSTEPQRRLLRVRAWGFWEIPLAMQCRDVLLESFIEMANTRPWYALTDTRRFPPQRADVQMLIGESMLKGSKLGLARAAFVVDSAVTRLQMQRLAAETHLVAMSVFMSEVEAFAWLLPG